MTEQGIVTIIVNVIASVSANLIVAAVTGLCVFFFSKRYASKLNFSGKMREFGFSEGVHEGGLSDCELMKLFRENDEIDMMYVSGNYLMEHIRTMVSKARAVQRSDFCSPIRTVNSQKTLKKRNSADLIEQNRIPFQKKF